MNCIIIDDDEFSRNALNQCINRVKSLNLVGSFENVPEALELLKKEKEVDLIFLDLELPQISGMDFLRNFNVPQQVIIVSNTKDYAAEAFDFNVTDFIVKPLNFARFLKAVNKAGVIKESFEDNNITPNSTELFIKKKNKQIRVPVNEISYIEALADYVNIYTEHQRFTILSTMKAIDNKLSQRDFARIHRSFIVRIDKIKEIEDGCVVIGDRKLPISRTYQDNLNKRITFL